MTLALPYLYLALAIVFEVVGTSALKASETFTRLVPSLVTLIAYTVSFVFLALSLRTIPIGIAYAMWAGLGIVLIAMIGWLWFKQPLDASSTYRACPDHLRRRRCERVLTIPPALSRS